VEGISPSGIGGKWQCMKCLRELTTKRNAMRHYQNAHVADVAACNLCGKVSKNPEALNTHMRQVHGISKSSFANRPLPLLEPEQST